MRTWRGKIQASGGTKAKENEDGVETDKKSESGTLSLEGAKIS